MDLQKQISRIQSMMGFGDLEKFTEYLNIGKKSDEVKMLQNELGIEDTGKFDKETEDCVKEFQEFTNIRIDGIVGPETRGKLNDMLGDKIKGWLGCKKTIKDQPIDSDQEPTNKDIVGSEWRSCKAWHNKGGLNKWGKNVSIKKSNSGFLVSYSGPSYGVSMAHAKNGTDTIHQVFNVLICEINPFLFKGNLKPDINGIRFKTGKSGKNSELEIFVPLESTDGTYQLNRRGGWGHDPGSGEMNQKCQKENKSGKKCIGPVTKVVQGPFGKITEHFITYKI